MKRKILNLSRGIMCMLLWTFSIFAFAQNMVVKGTVTDANDDALPGVNVVIKGISGGVATNIDGDFNITIPNENAVLVFSYIGYETQEITVGKQRNLSVVLKEDSWLIDEVVVVGYGTQRRETLTGSVAAVSSEEIMATKNPNVQNLLTGKLPGLRVVQKTSEPGQFTNQFDIRGLGSPLVIVDGVPRSDFSRMDPNDIESISILKDASAAIYGVRAANGVILITTKRGERGKAQIEYSGYYGVQTPAEILQPINAHDRALLFNETTMRNTTSPVKTYDDAYFEQLRNGELPDTDWYSQILRNSAPQQQHNVAVSGGGEKVDYYFNIGYNDQEGFFRTNSSNYKRYNLRSNVNAQITNDLTAGVRLNMIMDETNRQYESAFEIFKTLWRSRPNDPVYANDTEPYYYHPDNITNVVPMIDPNESGFISNKKNIFQSNMYLNYDMPFIQGLSARFMLSYDKTFDDNTSFRKEFNEYRYNAANNTYQSYTMNSKTNLNRYYGNSGSLLWQASLKYDQEFLDNHNVNILFLYEESYGQGYNFNASRFFDIPIPYLFAGNAADQVGTGSGLSESANKALVGRFNYDFLGKYMTEFSFRYDGSSKFPKGSQWGFFPSVLLGYRISEESFIKDNVLFLDNLKLRGTWGQLGDDSAAQFQFVEGFDYPQSGHNRQRLPAGNMFGNAFVNSLGFRNAPNPNITWFTATMFNVGIDVDMWNHLLGFSVDLFQRDRDGLLATPSVVAPGTFGAGMSQVNMNADRTKGLEIELRHRYRVNDFSYNITGHVALTRSLRTKIMQPDRSNSYDYWRNNQIGRYTDIWFGYGANGQYQSYDEIANSIYANASTLPGDPIYQDWNGDGVIDGDDMYPIATTTNPGGSFQDQRNYPLMNFGVTLSGQWKWIDLSLLFQGAAMSYVSYGEQLLNPLAWDGNALEFLFDRWHPVNPDMDPYDPSNQWNSGYYPYGRTRAEANSEFNIQNGAYMRLKSAEIGFTVPKYEFLSTVGVKNLRLYMNGYNLLTLTGVKGVDPEKPTEGYGYLYPLNRSYSFGGVITF